MKRCLRISACAISMSTLTLTGCGKSGATEAPGRPTLAFDTAVDSATPTQAATGLPGNALNELANADAACTTARTAPNYGAALRTASLRLLGRLPNLEDIKFIEAAGADPAQAKAAYETVISRYLDSAEYAQQLIKFWSDTFRMGGNDLVSAPTFAAQLTFENRSMKELFTATSGHCPTYDAANNTFTPADCNSGAPVEAGLLTNPAVMRQYDSTMSFRRVRFFQDTFACKEFPAEQGEPPADYGGTLPYTVPWAIESFAGSRVGGTVDFHDLDNLVCANCHATMNHQAVLFANFDDTGMYQADIQSVLPSGEVAARTDWLPEGEGPAWRFGQPVNDLAELGAAMAADPEIASCIVTRVRNWALGRGDVIDRRTPVPGEVIADQIETFSSSDWRLRDVIFAEFTSDEFTHF